MAAALSWEAASGLPGEIAALLGPEPELLLAIPEHRVPLPGGARDSQCDVFALVRVGSSTLAVAVEAKVDEPFGPTVSEWLKDASPGKLARLGFIQELLGLDGPLSAGLRYQLFHRTAAAVVEARRFGTDAAAMIVQSFSPDHRWFEDFAAFAGLFGDAPAIGQPVTVALPCGMPLTLGWAAGRAP